MLVTSYSINNYHKVLSQPLKEQGENRPPTEEKQLDIDPKILFEKTQSKRNEIYQESINLRDVQNDFLFIEKADSFLERLQKILERLREYNQEMVKTALFSKSEDPKKVLLDTSESVFKQNGESLIKDIDLLTEDYPLIKDMVSNLRDFRKMLSEEISFSDKSPKKWEKNELSNKMNEILSDIADKRERLKLHLTELEDVATTTNNVNKQRNNLREMVGSIDESKIHSSLHTFLKPDRALELLS